MPLNFNQLLFAIYPTTKMGRMPAVPVGGTLEIEKGSVSFILWARRSPVPPVTDPAHANLFARGWLPNAKFLLWTRCSTTTCHMWASV